MSQPKKCCGIPDHFLCLCADFATLTAQVESLTRERDNWKVDALARAINEGYWREKSEALRAALEPVRGINADQPTTADSEYFEASPPPESEYESISETAKRLGIEPKESKDAQACIDRLTGKRTAPEPEYDPSEDPGACEGCGSLNACQGECMDAPE